MIKSLVAAACVACCIGVSLARDDELDAGTHDIGTVRHEARQLRRDAARLRRIAERLDRELEEMENAALKLRERAASLEDGPYFEEQDDIPAGEERAAIARARATADELADKARDLSVRVREIEEAADSKDEKADRLLLESDEMPD
ncbi:MAG: hypothetical protein GF418_07605 [Chitinivibrionales bacterium]|nr:hypothetical protein [Chitinivibrionales bacterium]MBD3395478.1 hypothetical protein [Chitinivibrionales bacterium]